MQIIERRLPNDSVNHDFRLCNSARSDIGTLVLGLPSDSQYSGTDGWI